MKKVIFAGMVLAFGAVNVFADCSSALVADADSALKGQLIEDTGNNTGREVHCTNGDLVELAQGVGHSVDPTRVVGDWTASSSDGTVTYSYDGGKSYKFTLHSDGSKYYFCSGGSVKASGSLTSGSCAGAL